MAYCRKPLKALTTCPPANVFSRTDSLDRARKIVKIPYWQWVRFLLCMHIMLFSGT